ncbi:hypothetical protein HBN76_04570 [Pseudomonas sp. WS 5013]|uniref:hypothetical protein n=1 Tax=Pseudomonas sp. WS 5013 TaxID=2717475 RepID=UPI001474D4C3|nr:hypothetical protein [Pseudomonas sp. WS 5013]NMY40572.1 hypothetical protein [Pseudomonas sp. WS 5013]
MISAVEIEEQEFAVAIAELAGQPDIERFCLDGHLLIVQGVPQEVLEQASAAYHLQVTEQRSRALFKQQRAEAVAAIKVTTSAGHVFDGDEISQGRMARAILGLQAQGSGAVVLWVLSDNTVVQVGEEELTEALTLSGLRQAELWVQP